MSKLYGLIGYPVKHSYSAIMHNAAFRELGLDARYELFEVRPEELEKEFRRLLAAGTCGFNITIPYKEKIIEFLENLAPEARLAGAVNTVKVNESGKTKGFNTDGAGFIAHLTKVVGFAPRGRRISILGAGGAARAVSAALAENKAGSISLFDIARDKARGLADKLKADFPGCDIRLVSEPNALLQSRPDLLINATPVGMHKGDPLIFDSRQFHSKLLVYDLIYNPARTLLLSEAEKKGCAAVLNGLGMLLYQGALSFKVWLDVEPPIEIMERALREALTGQ